MCFQENNITRACELLWGNIGLLQEQYRLETSVEVTGREFDHPRIKNWAKYFTCNLYLLFSCYRQVNEIEFAFESLRMIEFIVASYFETDDSFFKYWMEYVFHFSDVYTLLLEEKREVMNNFKVLVKLVFDFDGYLEFYPKKTLRKKVGFIPIESRKQQPEKLKTLNSIDIMTSYLQNRTRKRSALRIAISSNNKSSRLTKSPLLKISRNISTRSNIESRTHEDSNVLGNLAGISFSSRHRRVRTVPRSSSANQHRNISLSHLISVKFNDENQLKKMKKKEEKERRQIVYENNKHKIKHFRKVKNRSISSCKLTSERDFFQRMVVQSFCDPNNNKAAQPIRPIEKVKKEAVLLEIKEQIYQRNLFQKKLIRMSARESTSFYDPNNLESEMRNPNYSHLELKAEEIAKKNSQEISLLKKDMKRYKRVQFKESLVTIINRNNDLLKEKGITQERIEFLKSQNLLAIQRVFINVIERNPTIFRMSSYFAQKKKTLRQTDQDRRRLYQPRYENPATLASKATEVLDA